MNFKSFFDKHYEVQQQILTNMKSAYLGHIVFPLSYALISDIYSVNKSAYLIYLGLTLFNSTLHFLLAMFFNYFKQVLGEKGWGMVYLTTITFEALSFIPPIYFSLNYYGLWSPESFYALLVLVIGLEGFSKYCYVYFESFLVGSFSLMGPLIIGLPFLGTGGVIVSVIALVYYIIVINSAWDSYKISNLLIEEKRINKESKDQIKELLDVLPSKVLQVTSNMEIEMANRNFLQSIGIFENSDYQKLSVDQVTLCSKWVESLSRNFKDKFTNFLEHEFSQTTFEMELPVNDEKRWHIITLKKSLLNNEKQELRIICVAIDIHTKKISEKELEQQRLINIQSSKLASMGEIAGGIAHEINNPLAVVMGTTSVLLKKIERGDINREDFESKLQRIKKVGLRISKIIRGMRNLMRDDSVISNEQFYIKDLLDDSLGLCEQRFKNSSIKLIVKAYDETLKTKCNYQQIGQILINLLNNAHDVLIDAIKKEVEVRVETYSDKIYINIYDSGPGIKDESKIFQPFYTTKPVGKGTGLGLSLSKKMALKNNGDLIYSRVGNRTLFQIILTNDQILKKAI